MINSATGRPIASAREYPKVISAAGFQSRTRPSELMTITGSGAARRTWLESALPAEI
jgi:hypothetical protein